MSGNKLPQALAATEDDIQLLLAAQCHLGTKNCDKTMEPYVYKRRADGMSVFALNFRLWEGPVCRGLCGTTGNLRGNAWGVHAGADGVGAMGLIGRDIWTDGCRGVIRERYPAGWHGNGQPEDSGRDSAGVNGLW